MPLIDINPAQQSGQQGNPPVAPTPQVVSNAVGSLDAEKKLSTPMNVAESTDGVKEFQTNDPALQATSPVVPVGDISEDLKEKLASLAPLQSPGNSTTVQQNPVSPPVVSQPTQNVVQDVVQQNPTQLPPVASQQTQPAPMPNPQPSVGNLQEKKLSIHEILKMAITSNASDIHLGVGYRAVVRVDGSLQNLNSAILTPEDLDTYVAEIIKGRPDLKIDEVSEMDLGYSFENRRLRVNIHKKMGNLGLVARIIPEKINSMEELQLPEILKQLTNVNSGLILVTGPTGSGKSTTLASILNHINVSKRENIVTLEDPIEFVFPKASSIVTQREFGIDFKSWGHALRSILRQDPNIVLVGEMRDFETIASTITVSETGHLVFATLHTNSAAQTIDRIIDIFPEAQQPQIRAQLANVITAVISQRLVKKLEGGRKAVMEIMVATPAVKNAIREGKTHQIDNMIQTGQDYGMVAMEKALVDLVKKGIISLEEAKATSVKPDEIDLLMRK